MNVQPTTGKMILVSNTFAALTFSMAECRNFTHDQSQTDGGIIDLIAIGDDFDQILKINDEVGDQVAVADGDLSRGECSVSSEQYSGKCFALCLCGIGHVNFVLVSITISDQTEQLELAESIFSKFIHPRLESSSGM